MQQKTAQVEVAGGGKGAPGGRRQGGQGQAQGGCLLGTSQVRFNVGRSMSVWTTDIYMHDMQSCIGTMNRVLCASAQMRIMASASFGPFESFELLGCWRDQELVFEADGNGLTLSDRSPRNIEPDGAESLTLCTYIVVMPG